MDLPQWKKASYTRTSKARSGKRSLAAIVAKIREKNWETGSERTPGSVL